MEGPDQKILFSRRIFTDHLKPFSLLGITNFKIHLNIHKHDRPFICHLCNNSFTQLSTLLNHERIHFNLRPYKCSLCNYTSRVLANKLQHERIYHQNKLLKCDTGFCLFQTKFSSCLYRHKKIFHSNDSFHYRKNLNYFLRKYNISEYYTRYLKSIHENTTSWSV